jgi:hypothetical protein
VIADSTSLLQTPTIHITIAATTDEGAFGLLPLITSIIPDDVEVSTVVGVDGVHPEINDSGSKALPGGEKVTGADVVGSNVATVITIVLQAGIALFTGRD